MNRAVGLYSELLQKVALAQDEDEIARHLAEAFELGRRFLELEVPPDVLMLVHHRATEQLARQHPDCRFADVAGRLARPLMEVSMAYGLSFRDQAEQRYRAMMDTRLAQSQKLEAIGALAAGIAHDFNSLLGCIIGFAEMTGDLLPAGTAGHRNIQGILGASERARKLVAKMLTFARESVVTTETVDLVQVLDETLELLRAACGEALTFDCQLTLQPAFVTGDPGQLQQVIMNLCINAADAMDRCGTIEIGIHPAADFDWVLPCQGSGILLEVVDHGHGMTPQVLARIFDPFFTTKGPTHGTGLGLSVTYGIVTAHGGAIDVDSRVGEDDHGTRFRVWLPAAEPVQRVQTAAQTPPVPAVLADTEDRVTDMEDKWR